MDIYLENIAVAFGKVVRRQRKECKLSQEQLGFESDLQRIYISKLELGQQQPSITTIFKLASGLNCSAVYLIEKTVEELNDMNSSKLSSKE